MERYRQLLLQHSADAVAHATLDIYYSADRDLIFRKITLPDYGLTRANIKTEGNDGAFYGGIIRNNCARRFAVIGERMGVYMRGTVMVSSVTVEADGVYTFGPGKASNDEMVENIIRIFPDDELIRCFDFTLRLKKLPKPPPAALTYFARDFPVSPPLILSASFVERYCKLRPDISLDMDTLADSVVEWWGRDAVGSMPCDPTEIAQIFRVMDIFGIEMHIADEQ